MNISTFAKKYQFVVGFICGIIIISIQAESPNAPNYKTQKGLPGLEASQDQFDLALAPSDNNAIVGAPDEDYDINGGAYLSNAGSAYFYEQDIKGNWIKTQKVVSSDRATNDLFGWAVATAADVAVITAPQTNPSHQDHSRSTDLGSAYIFKREETGHWKESQKIVAVNPSTHMQFGTSASISADFLIISAIEKVEDQHRSNSNQTVGAAYIFEKDQNGKWYEVQKIVSEGRGAGEDFGSKVAIYGSQIIIETRSPHKNARMENEYSSTSAVYIYDRNAEGVWMQHQKILNPKKTFHCLEKLF